MLQCSIQPSKPSEICCLAEVLFVFLIDVKKYILIVVKFHMSSHLHCSSGQNFVDINLGDKKLIYGVLKEFQYMMF